MLDLDALLAPVNDDAATGEDLSFSVEFDQILEFRRADDPTLDQGEWQTDIKYADWPNVASHCQNLLLSRTKDLRLAGWLAEAATQLDGFAGLAQGYRLVAGLCERYWDQIHPLAQDGDQEERIGNLTWLLSNSLQWMRATPIVSAPQGRYTLLDFDTAHARSGSGEASDARATLEQLESAKHDTPHTFYRQLMLALEECEKSLTELQTAVDAKLGVDGPSFTSAREQIKDLLHTAKRFAKESGLLVDGEASESPVNPEASSAAEPGETNAPQARGPGGPPSNRREALTQLRQVAEYFRRTEPHSPVAYLAEKAARWGEMPLHVWLKRVIKDDNVLYQMQELLDLDQDMSNS